MQLFDRLTSRIGALLSNKKIRWPILAGQKSEHLESPETRREVGLF